jgi:uncharacterized repeat protein (TIGR03803 family)
MKKIQTPEMRRDCQGQMERVHGLGLVRLAWFYSILSAGFIVAGGLQAQTLTTLYTFEGTNGDQPESPLVLSDGALYGATRYGGKAGHGVVFKINPDGTGFSTLYKFTDSDIDGNGAEPAGPLLVTGGSVYGTASGIPSGTVFRISTDGSAQNMVCPFSGGVDDGPFGGVILNSNTLYGTTSSGVVFKVNTNGTDFAVLRCIACDPVFGGEDCTIYGGLVLIGDYLYGTTFGGGLYDAGMVFKLSVDGTTFIALHHFQGSDGSGPFAGLLLSGNRLYGTTTSGGGTNSVGVVFAINPDGTGFTNLHSFVGFNGGWPQGGLICSGNTLYGTTKQGGGIGGAGTVFSLRTDGTEFRSLYTFTGGADGGAPTVGVTLVGNDLYGTTSADGDQDNGTIFRFSLPGPAATSFIRSANNLVITWPTNTSGLSLQSSADLANWTTVTAAPLVVNGSYTVTNSISASCRFFRLNR